MPEVVNANHEVVNSQHEFDFIISGQSHSNLKYDDQFHSLLQHRSHVESESLENTTFVHAVSNEHHTGFGELSTVEIFEDYQTHTIHNHNDEGVVNEIDYLRTDDVNDVFHFNSRSQDDGLSIL